MAHQKIVASDAGAHSVAKLQPVNFRDLGVGQMDCDVGSDPKLDIVQKLVATWPLLSEVEKLNLLAAVRCFGCRHFEACETARSNPADQLLTALRAL